MVEESSQEKQWMIFLSHSSEDKQFVDWLYGKLLSANLTVWYDKYEILVGDSIVTRVAEGLEGSEFLIIVISQNSLKSNWVKNELEPKILQHIESGQVTIIPVVLDNIDPGDVSIFLKGKRWIQFPHEGSDEAFRVLLENIEGHVQRRGLIKSSRLSNKTAVYHALQNPFGLRGGVEPECFIVPEILVGAITEDIIKRQSISIIGAQMMGKTSLLKFLASSLYSAYYRVILASNFKLHFAYLDLQEYTGKNRDELLPELARTMSKQLVPSMHFQGNTHRQALDWIKATVGQRQAGRPFWILLFDEFDQAVNLSGIDKNLFDELRSLPQHYNLSYIIASHHKLIDLTLLSNMGTSQFFTSFREHFLAVWDESTARNLMFKPSGNELDVFNETDFTYMMRLTAGHPLLLQISCYHLFNACREIGTHRQIGKKVVDYDQLLDSYMQEAESVYRYYWNNEINDTERKWLLDFRWAISQRDSTILQALKRSNHAIQVKLANLGFLLSKSGSLEIPLGLQAFLKETLS